MADSMPAPLLSHAGERFPKALVRLSRIGFRLAMKTKPRTKTVKSAKEDAVLCDFTRLMDTHPAMPTRADVNQYTPLSKKVAVAVASIGARSRLIFMGSERTGPNTVR